MWRRALVLSGFLALPTVATADERATSPAGKPAEAKPAESRPAGGDDKTPQKPFKPVEDEDAPAGDGSSARGTGTPRVETGDKDDTNTDDADSRGDNAAASGDAPVILPGVYQGVTPGTKNLPPRAPRLPVKGPALVTWTGFQLKNGVPTVFVQLSHETTWTITESKGQLVVHLKGASVPIRNNLRPLKVKDFGTAVREVSTRRRGKDVEVTISLDRPVSHRERLDTDAAGFKLLLIELI